jgi:phosphoserine phosphatase
MAPKGLVVWDMDRTLLNGRIVGALGSALGFEAKVKELSAARNAGRISQVDVTIAIAKFLQGTTPEVFDGLIRPIPLSPGAEEAVQALHKAGVAQAICSDSYTRATEPLGKRLGMERWAANVLEVREGTFTGGLVPYGPALGLGPSAQVLEKKEAVPLLCKAMGVPLERTCMVGDGDQDGLAMELTGLGIAYHGTPLAQRNATHRLEGSLAPVAALVQDWLAQA